MAFYKTRLQNRIASSRYALPGTAAIIATVWIGVALGLGQNIWAELVGTAIATLLMVELNNTNVLMRTYSRMVSCSFLVLFTMFSLPSPSASAILTSIAFIACYLLMWACYQQHDSQGRTFYGFACIGLASLAFIQVGYLVPLLWFILGAFANAMNVRSFCASLLGLAVPYWFAAVVCFITGHTDWLISHLSSFIDYQPLWHYGQITVKQLVNLSFITLLAIVGTVHFMRNSSGDKIRTRKVYESFILANTYTFVCLILQPQHYDQLTAVLIVNTAPLIAHFITYTRTFLTNIFFMLMLAGVALITLLNIFLPTHTLL